MRNAPDCRKRPIKDDMRRQIGRRAQGAFDGSAIEVDNYQILRLHGFIVHAARFDHHQPFPAVDPAGISKCVEHQAAPYQFEICFQYLFPKILESHGFPLAAAAIRLRLIYSPRGSSFSSTGMTPEPLVSMASAAT